jgi:hypothetical protein
MAITGHNTLEPALHKHQAVAETGATPRKCEQNARMNETIRVQKLANGLTAKGKT